MTDIAKLNDDLQELRQQLDQTGVFTQMPQKAWVSTKSKC